jgi:hypothetical protein
MRPAGPDRESSYLKSLSVAVSGNLALPVIAFASSPVLARGLGLRTGVISRRSWCLSRSRQHYLVSPSRRRQ